MFVPTSPSCALVIEIAPNKRDASSKMITLRLLARRRLPRRPAMAEIIMLSRSASGFFDYYDLMYYYCFFCYMLKSAFFKPAEGWPTVGLSWRPSVCTCTRLSCVSDSNTESKYPRATTARGDFLVYDEMFTTVKGALIQLHVEDHTQYMRECNNK